MADENNNAPPSGTDFTPAVPLNDTGASFDSAATDDRSTRDRIRHDRAADELGGAADAFREQAQKLVSDAQERARSYALDGKSRATGALGEASKVMNDAADTIDEKLGNHYGQYARSAADYVDGLARSLDAKDVDDIVEDIRGFVQKSPAVAIGTAAAVGFVLARLVRSGIDAERHDV